MIELLIMELETKETGCCLVLTNSRSFCSQSFGVTFKNTKDYKEDKMNYINNHEVQHVKKSHRSVAKFPPMKSCILHLWVFEGSLEGIVPH